MDYDGVILGSSWQRKGVNMKNVHRSLCLGCAILALGVIHLPVSASTVELDSIETGLYGSDGVWATPGYTTGIANAYGPETRGLVAFDVRPLPHGVIRSATLTLQNPYTVNEAGGPLELHLHGLPGMNRANYTGNTALNLSNFASIGGSFAPLWGSTSVEPIAWPGSIVSFALPADALTALRQAADGSGHYSGDFFAFGLRIVKADAEEPKPLQYVFGGTWASPTVRLSVDVAPVPLPQSWATLLAGMGFLGVVALRRTQGRRRLARTRGVTGWLLPFLAALGIGMAGSAQAAVVSQSFTHTLKLGDNVPEGLDVASFSVNRFDPLLGSLTAVDFHLASDFSGGATFYHPTLSLSFGYTPRHY